MPDTRTALSAVPVLDLSRQFAAVGAEITAAVGEVCSAGRFVLGREVAELETKIAAMTGATDAAGCASGTDALWLALVALGVGRGDAVVTTPFTFFASVSSILRAEARPVLADIDPATFNISAAAVEEAVASNPDVRAVMPVHLYGQCADWDALSAVCAPNNLLMVEDAAQAFGASWNGVQAGALGQAAAFSFYPTKNLSAWGDAGLTTFRSAEVAERAKMMRAHGMRRRYFHDEVGWNSRLDTVQAAVLLVKLKYIAQWNESRSAVAARYNESLAGVDEVVRPYSDPRGTHVWHQYVVRVPRRDELRAYLAERGIGSEVYYPVPLHLQEALKDLGYREGQFPQSEKAAREVLALPIYPELRGDEQARVVDAIRSFFGA